MEAALPQGDFDSEEDYQLSPRPAGAAALSNFLQNFYFSIKIFKLSRFRLQFCKRKRDGTASEKCASFVGRLKKIGCLLVAFLRFRQL